MIRVTDSRGEGGRRNTVTLNVHELARCCASVATHVTFESPMENAEPLGGVQTIAIGGIPPVTVGGSNVTDVWSVLARTVCGAGHASIGPVPGVGPVGDPAHRVVKIAPQRIKTSGP